MPSDDDVKNAPTPSQPVDGGKEGPTWARLVSVAAGLSEWTPSEQQWLQKHPKWRGYEQRLREEIEVEPRDSPGRG